MFENRTRALWFAIIGGTTALLWQRSHRPQPARKPPPAPAGPQPPCPRLAKEREAILAQIREWHADPTGSDRIALGGARPVDDVLLRHVLGDTLAARLIAGLNHTDPLPEGI